MTRPDDVRAAVELGVDAIGMILHADSPRVISLAQAQLLRAEVPAFVSLVGVFVDCPASKIKEYTTTIGLDLIQLHGDESNDFGAKLGVPFIKAIRAKSADYVSRTVGKYPQARALLLDPYVPGMHGGTGQPLPPELWPDTDQNLVLAGGLSPTNLSSAVQQLRPFAVDINSGVESAPGIKDCNQIALALSAISALERR